MVAEILTEQMQSDGRQLTKALDDSHVQATSAFWFYFEDVQQWRFVFASAIVDVIGPRETYKKVQKIIKKLGQQLSTINLTNVVAYSVKHPLVYLLREFVITNSGISAIRLSRCVINGQFIEDALIYRMTKPI